MDVVVDRFRAMGTDVEVTVVDGDSHLLTVARDRIRDLEQRWSRFLPASEVSRVNRALGAPIRVSAETVTLMARAREGMELTGGRFDPLQLTALEAIGYRVSFERLDCPSRAASGAPNPSSSGDAIDVDAARSTVRLTGSAGFDPGGIGKGLAADFVAEELRAQGVAGVCINIGGDVRVSGVAPSGDAWIVAVRDRPDDDPVAYVSIAEGAVATTSRSRRRWQTADGVEHHHVIDPLTRTSAVTPVRHATAIASEGWRAEVLSKVAFLDRVAGIDFAERLGATAMVATDTGCAVGPRWSQFARVLEVVA